MSTTNVNRVKYGVVGGGEGIVKINYKVNNSTFPIKQGDLVFLNAGIVKPVTADADAAAIAGIALQPSAVSSNVDNSTAPAEKSIAVGSGVIAGMNTTAAESYTDGTLVYVGADAQTITTVAGTNPVGVVHLPSNVSSVTGATGVTVDVLVFSKVHLKISN